MNELEFHNYNIEIEQMYLGSLITSPDLIKETIIRPEYLSPGHHENLLKTLYEMMDKNIPISLEFIVSRLGKAIDQVGGVVYLSEISVVPSIQNFKGYENIIIEFYQTRQEIVVANLLKIGEITRSEAKERLIELEDLGNSDDDNGDIKEALYNVYDKLESNTKDLTGSSTGYRDLDRITGGLNEGDLVIIAARPSVGKTAFALNLANNVCTSPLNGEGDVSVVFSLEMSTELLLARMVGFIGNLDSQLMRNARENFQTEHWRKATMAIGALTNMPLKVFDKPGVNMNYIRSKVKMVKQRFPDRKMVVFIDYLQLIRGDEKRNGSREQEISQISRDLKAMARELKVCVVALSQLSRSVEQRQDKRPMLSDLRESGAIEQDADIVGFLYREDYYDKETENQNMVEVILGKNRNGATGTVTMAFVKEFQKFVNIDGSQHQKPTA